MRVRLGAAATLLLLVSMALGLARADQAIDGVAAIVGEEVILRSEVEIAAVQLLARVRTQQGSVPPELANQLRDEALRTLIDDKLILMVAERNNLEASHADIDQAIEGIAADEGVTVDAIYTAVATQGLTREEYRDQLGAQLTKMRVVAGSVQSRITVSEEEIQDLYQRRYGNVVSGERLRVLHILLPWPAPRSETTHDQAWQMANSIRTQALETGDFAGLARRVSAAPTSSQGGLTVFRRGEAPPVIERALSKLSPGEISPVVETEHGLNLFQFIDRFDPSTVRLEDVEDQLRYELEERKTGPELEKWLGELRERQYIEIVAQE